jgi:RNA polymerase sigma-70 factor, ECF subfamily
MAEAVEAVENDELVRRIAARLAEAPLAEAELCRRFSTRAQLYGLKHLKHPEHARDLAQAVMVAVLLAARDNKIADASRLDRFVLGTCRNVASRMRETDAQARPTESAELEALAGAAPELEVIDQKALYGCLRRLDTRGRRVVYLAFHEQASAEEIAAGLGTTAGNVRVLRHRAVAQLRECLDGGRRHA